MLETLEERALLPGIPAGTPEQADFFLAPDREVWDFLTGGQVPEWGAGVAIPDRQVAVLPLYDVPAGGPSGRDRTAIHEWAHLGLHAYMGELSIPRWFDEGYAQWAAGGWDVRQAWRLRVALASGSAPPLDSIALSWPREQARAEVAYLLTASAVEFLVAGSGERGLEVFLQRWREMGSFEAAFRRTFGETSGAFEQRWIEHVEDRYGWVLILNDLAIFWAVAGIALLLLIRVRIQRNRERMARLRATEPPERPAYWEPPPMPPIGGFESDREDRVAREAGQRSRGPDGSETTDPPWS